MIKLEFIKLMFTSVFISRFILSNLIVTFNAILGFPAELWEHKTRNNLWVFTNEYHRKPEFVNKLKIFLTIDIFADILRIE